MGYRATTPSIRRVFEALDPNQLERCCWNGSGCQTAIAAQVIECQGNYLLTVKDNQPQLAEAIEDYFQIGEQHAWANLQPPHCETLDKGAWAGRLETQGKTTAEIRYLIRSTAADAYAILNATQLHWGIENGLHRCLDVAFREDADACAVHLRQALANLNVLRKLSLNLFRLDATRKLSLPRKRKQAVWKPDYLFDLPMAEF